MNNLEFKNLAKKLGVELSDKMLDQFEDYFNFLVEYNNKVNLTAITEKEEVYTKHFLDCLIGVNVFSKNANLCDVGAGAGFPSVVLKIARPDLNITLVDSLNKRIVFLNKLINKLGLKNIVAIHARAEDFAKENREKFDYVTARAVANLSTLSEYCLPLVNVGCYFAPYKSGFIEEELEQAKSAIKTLGGKTNEVLNFVLPKENVNRTIIKIKKLGPTSKKYPRSGNKPRKQPL